MPEVQTLLEGQISKLDHERRLVFGWASVVTKDGEDVVDGQGDVIDLESLEDATYEYVLTSREADEMHVVTEGVGKLVESVMLTNDKMEAMGVTGPQEGLWVGYKIQDEGAWQKVKDGTYPMFSIRGIGTREPIDG